MGFCIFNHVAVAARYLQRHHGLNRVLIVDWDYHHGNGTQDIFCDDGSVFYFSTHHYGAYPGTGAAGDTGVGDGEGSTMNVPLPIGATDEQLLSALRDRLVPVAIGFRPDFMLISSGFDAMQHDLLGQFDVTHEGFADATRIVTGLTGRLCDGRIVSVLEGGYRLDGLAACIVAHAGALLAAADPAQ
jgi:acetoin utilization deacetylase AcuC-like enzyme